MHISLAAWACWTSRQRACGSGMQESDPGPTVVCPSGHGSQEAEPIGLAEKLPMGQGMQNEAPGSEA